VDRAGQIAYIGHPMYLNVVMPKVVAGTASARDLGDEVAKIEAELNRISGTLVRDPKAGLQAQGVRGQVPPLVDFLPSVRAKLSYLPKYGKEGEAKEYAEALVSRAIKQDDRFILSMVSAILRLGDGKQSKELLAAAVKAAEAEVRMTNNMDASALINLASTFFVAGDKAKAKEYAGKAVLAADGESTARKQSIEKEAKRLANGEKEDKK
jgi:hypothetical protein